MHFTYFQDRYRAMGRLRALEPTYLVESSRIQKHDHLSAADHVRLNCQYEHVIAAETEVLEITSPTGNQLRINTTIRRLQSLKKGTQKS